MRFPSDLLRPLSAPVPLRSPSGAFVTGQVEAMVPFAVPNPAPACERRRLRLVNHFLFSVLARGDPFCGTGLDGPDGIFSDVGGAEGGGVSGQGSGSVQPLQGQARRRRRADERQEWSSPGGARASTDFEERLYAVLGALLEVREGLVFPVSCVDGGARTRKVGALVARCPRWHGAPPRDPLGGC